MNSNEQELPNIENWSKLLKASEVPNLEMIVSSDFAIPIGNDFVELVFSVMNNLWTDERNRLNINTVRTEICTKINYSITCNEFKIFVSDQKGMLNAVKTNKKYTVTNIIYCILFLQ